MQDSDTLENRISSEAQNGKLTCAQAVNIAAARKESPLAVGRTVDKMGIRLIECQLGLFGCNHPSNRKVQPAPSVSADLEEEIRRGLKNGCLPCIVAWSISQKTTIAKMDVAAACEHLKIKIKPCQLGAF